MNTITQTKWVRDSPNCTAVISFYSKTEFSVSDEMKCGDMFTAHGTFTYSDNKIILSYLKIQGKDSNYKLMLIRHSEESITSFDNDGKSTLYKKLQL